MSLINQMLRDLERRKGGRPPPENVLLSGLGWRPEAPGGSGRAWGRYAAVGAVAVALLSAYALYVSRSPAPFDGAARGTGGDGAVNRPAARFPAPPAEAGPGGDYRQPPAPMAVAAAKAPSASADAAATGSIDRPAGSGGGGTTPAPESPGPSGAASSAPHAVAYADRPASPSIRFDRDVGVDRGKSASGHGAKRTGVAGQASQGNGAPAAGHGVQRTPMERAARLQRQGLALVEQGRTREARDRLADALDLAPDQVASRRALAGLMIKAGELDAAAAVLDEGLHRAPQDPTLIALRARIEVMQGHNRTARTLLESHPPAMSDDPSYYALLAAVYQRLGDYGPAGSLYQRLVDAHPDNAVWWLGLGIAKEATGERAAARRAYAKARQAGPLSPALRKFVQGKLATL